MAKLYFRYGAMGASKTANALMVAYNYEEKGLTPLVMKPAIENRDGAKSIKSRIGLYRECDLVEDVIANEWPATRKYFAQHTYDAVIVDECQFMSEEQVEQLWRIVNELKIPVICYGLKTDFQNQLFPAAVALLKYADVIEEMKTICWCGDGAKCNARLDADGNVVRTGSQIQMGGAEDDLPTYLSLCTKHYLDGDIGPKMREKFSKRK
jgi:thymidine kinase